jgi:hypothetical protein
LAARYAPALDLASIPRLVAPMVSSLAEPRQPPAARPPCCERRQRLDHEWHVCIAHDQCGGCERPRARG